MPMYYKIDIIAALKEKGYNTNRLRTENLLSQSAIQSIREKKPISWSNIAKICALLECQPGDILICNNDESSNS